MRVGGKEKKERFSSRSRSSRAPFLWMSDTQAILESDEQRSLSSTQYINLLKKKKVGTCTPLKIMWEPAFDRALFWCFKVLLQFSNWTFFIDLCWILTDRFKKGSLLHCLSLLWLHPSIERKWDSLRQLSQLLNGSTTERTANNTDFSESTVARQTNEANDCMPIIAFCYFEIEKYGIVPFRGASALKIE